MKQKLKRPIQAYLIFGLWIVFTFYYSTKNSSDFGQWTLRILTVIGLIALVHMIIRPDYFEVSDNKLFINKGFFRTKIVNLDEIEKVVIGAGPFASSKIILKDKTTIKYLDSQIKDNELKEFMSKFNIPVE